MDDSDRKLERESFIDPRALARLQRHRCRTGQCCAHAPVVSPPVAVEWEWMCDGTGENMELRLWAKNPSQHDQAMQWLIDRLRVDHSDPANTKCTRCGASGEQPCVTVPAGNPCLTHESRRAWYSHGELSPEPKETS